MTSTPMISSAKRSKVAWKGGFFCLKKERKSRTLVLVRLKAPAEQIILQRLSANIVRKNMIYQEINITVVMTASC
jgi:hypothetical protein